MLLFNSTHKSESALHPPSFPENISLWSLCGLWRKDGESAAKGSWCSSTFEPSTLGSQSSGSLSTWPELIFPLLIRALRALWIIDTSEDPASYRRAQDLLQFFCNFTSQLNPTWILCSLQWQRLSVYTTNLFSMTNRTKHIIWQQIEISSKDTGWFFWLVRPKNDFWH